MWSFQTGLFKLVKSVLIAAVHLVLLSRQQNLRDFTDSAVFCSLMNQMTKGQIWLGEYEAMIYISCVLKGEMIII